MNKATRILLAIGLILAVATPALAEFKFSGNYRLIAYNEEKKSSAAANTTDEEGDSQQFIDQRFRAKLEYGINDNVAVVYYGEVDTVWGEANKAAYGQGGMSNSRGGGADGVNIETKNVYLDMKFGNTAVTLGIQGIADSFESIVANDDMAGIKVVHKIGNTTLTGVYSKWDEDTATPDGTTTTTYALDQNGDGVVDGADLELVAPIVANTAAMDDLTDFVTSGGSDPLSATTIAALNAAKVILKGTAKANVYAGGRSDDDDYNFWLAEVKQKFGDAFTAGAGVYFVDDQDANNLDTATKQVWFYGLNGAATFGNFGVSGFAMMQDGEYDSKTAGADIDYKGWAASVKATMKMDNNDFGLRAIYFPSDDDSKDNEGWQGFKGEYAFVNENQMQFLVDKFVCNDSKEQYTLIDAIDGGYGLMAFILSGNHKLPQDMYVNWGAGYYLADDDSRNDEVGDSREGKTLGYEIAARVGKKYFEKVDISLNASYADYGDFYDNTAANGDDPDATYKAYLMVNVPF